LLNDHFAPVAAIVADKTVSLVGAAVQFGSLVIPSVPKNVGLKGSPVNIAPRAAKAKEKPAGLSRRVRSLPLAV
jgi:hypothetical protein